ncbi:MAG: DHH family phosphoesterase [Desulfuromonas sp.]|nr:MAG: DHH family phosphoesterase [Desulfuromonas sp.]
MQTAIEEILKHVREGERFLVTAHENPDGDALASTLALTLALREAGKKVEAYNRDGVPDTFKFLPGSDSVVSELDSEQQFDAVFVLDSGDLRRAGNDLQQRGKTLINIDHHPGSEFGDVILLDTAASATGTLIYRILKAGDIPISRNVAVCIYTAITSDTGSFRYSNANPEAFQVAAEMVDCGVDTWAIASHLYESQPLTRLRLLGEALQTLEISPCGRFAAVTCTLEMFSNCQAGPEHTDGFVNYPRSLEGVEVAIFFRQVRDDAVKVGFRSKGLVDVGSLAAALGGGGHHNAAGVLIDGDIEAVHKDVFARVQQLMP